MGVRARSHASCVKIVPLAAENRVGWPRCRFSLAEAQPAQAGEGWLRAASQLLVRPCMMHAKLRWRRFPVRAAIGGWGCASVQLRRKRLIPAAQLPTSEADKSYSACKEPNIARSKYCSGSAATLASKYCTRTAIGDADCRPRTKGASCHLFFDFTKRTSKSQALIGLLAHGIATGALRAN